MTNTIKYELKGFKIYHKDNKSKYDQLMKVMRTMKYKRKYKYDQLMKVMRT
jgi:biopolymer transport protein ExbD